MGKWAWNGREYVGGINRIENRSQQSVGAFIMSDDLEYVTVIPEPSVIVGLAAGLGLLLVRRRR